VLPTIDLDRDDRESVPPRAVRRRRVAPVAAAVSLFVLLTLTGLPSISPLLSRAWTGPALHGFLWVDDRSVYTLEPALTGVALTARSIGSGVVRWRYPLTGTLAELYATEPPVLVPMFGPEIPARAATIASSATTGLLLGIYPVPAMPLAYFAGSVAVLIDRVPTGEPRGIDPGGPNRVTSARGEGQAAFDAWQEMHRVTAIDLESGRMAWARTIPPGTTWALPGAHPWRYGFIGESTSPGWMAVTSIDGDTEVWDLETGAVRARADVGALGQWSSVNAMPDVLIVNSGGWPSAVTAGYGAADLKLRWREPMPVIPDPLSWPVPCGPLVCLVAGAEAWGVDFGAGELVWRQPIADVYAVKGGTLAAATIVDGPVLVDAATGRWEAVPGNWRVAESRTREGPLVVYRPGPRGFELGLLDVAAGDLAVAPLGGAGSDAPPERCEIAGAHLVCTYDGLIRDGRVQVWRLRHSPA